MWAARSGFPSRPSRTICARDCLPGSPTWRNGWQSVWLSGYTPPPATRGTPMGSVIKKRRKRMAKKKHRKLLRKTRVQRRRQGK
ncbi:hypothetical protein Pen01_34720 [Phytomonospora endophytica]|nr:hypothetical protein Pen01_34720 [Phytomonospora endophytica]